MKDRSNESTNTARRVFLRNAAVTGGAVALAGATGAAIAAPPSVAHVEEPSTQTGPKGYRLTDHIRAYYRVAGL